MVNADPYEFMFSTDDGSRPDPLPSHYDGFSYKFKSKEHFDYYSNNYNYFNKYPFEDLPKNSWDKSDLTDFGETDDEYPYCVFGLKRSSSDEDMKKAYRDAILKAHPDKGGDAEEFRMYRQAWENYLR